MRTNRIIATRATDRRQSSIKTRRTTVRDNAPATKPNGAKPDEPASVEVELSAKLKRLVEAVRAPFKAYVAQTHSWLQSRMSVMPAFIKAWLAYKEETGLTIADFVRLFVPDLPVQSRSKGITSPGYRDHQAYRAADYIMRLYREEARAKASTPEERAAREASKPATPLDGMARLIAAVLPLISADQVPRLWAAIEAELHWSERQVDTLQNRLKTTDPLINMRPPRGAGGLVPQLRIAPVHKRDQDETEQDEARTGTHG